MSQPLGFHTNCTFVSQCATCGSFAPFLAGSLTITILALAPFPSAVQQAHAAPLVVAPFQRCRESKTMVLLVLVSNVSQNSALVTAIVSFATRAQSVVGVGWF
jgi:hypothetical protein